MAKGLGFEYGLLKLHTVCPDCLGEEVFCQKKKKGGRGRGKERTCIGYNWVTNMLNLSNVCINSPLNRRQQLWPGMIVAPISLFLHLDSEDVRGTASISSSSHKACQNIFRFCMLVSILHVLLTIQAAKLDRIHTYGALLNADGVV